MMGPDAGCSRSSVRPDARGRSRAHRVAPMPPRPITASPSSDLCFSAHRDMSARSLATGARRWLGCQVICGDPGRFQFFWACWRAMMDG
jgi:hypothetical protein